MNAAKRVRRPAETRRIEIVDAALRLADAVGPDALTTEAIAAEIGLTQPALFRHFARKELIWTAVAERLAEIMAKARADAVAPGTPPERAIVALAEAQAGAIASTPGLAAILFSRELHVRNVELRAGLAANQKMLHGELAAAIERGKSAGRFAGDLDTADAAFLVIGVIQSAALRWSLTGRRLDLVAEVRRLCGLLARGFAR